MIVVTILWPCHVLWCDSCYTFFSFLSCAPNLAQDRRDQPRSLSRPSIDNRISTLFFFFSGRRVSNESVSSPFFFKIRVVGLESSVPIYTFLLCAPYPRIIVVTSQYNVTSVLSYGLYGILGGLISHRMTRSIFLQIR